MLRFCSTAMFMANGKIGLADSCYRTILSSDGVQVTRLPLCGREAWLVAHVVLPPLGQVQKSPELRQLNIHQR